MDPGNNPRPIAPFPPLFPIPGVRHLAPASTLATANQRSRSLGLSRRRTRLRPEPRSGDAAKKSARVPTRLALLFAGHTTRPRFKNSGVVGRASRSALIPARISASVIESSRAQSVRVAGRLGKNRLTICRCRQRGRCLRLAARRAICLPKHFHELRAPFMQPNDRR